MWALPIHLICHSKSLLTVTQSNFWLGSIAPGTCRSGDAAMSFRDREALLDSMLCDGPRSHGYTLWHSSNVLAVSLKDLSASGST